MAFIAPHKDSCPPGSHDSPEVLITSVSSNLNEELTSPLTAPNPLPEDEVQAVEEHGPLPQNDTAAFLLLWVVGIVLAPLACAMCFAGYQIFQQFSLDKWMAAARECVSPVKSLYCCLEHLVCRRLRLMGIRNFPSSVLVTIVEAAMGMFWAAKDQDMTEEMG